MNDILLGLFYFLAGMLGMFSHFLKKQIKGETFSDIKSYFTTHAKTTLLAFIGLLVGFATIIGTDTANFVSAFLVGYTADSALNKLENKK